MNCRLHFLLIGLILVVSISGCKKEEVRVYELPKAHPKVDNPHGEGGSGKMPRSMAALSAMSAKIVWDTPENWKQKPEQGMRYASFDIGVDPDVIDNSVISLARQGQAESYLPNVNRWLQQVGIEVAKDDAGLEQYLQRFEIEGEKAVLVDIVGPEGDYGDPGKRIVGAIIPQGGKVWYFKMIGDSDDMQPHGDDFAGLIKSVHFERDTREPAHDESVPHEHEAPAMDTSVIEDTSKGVGPVGYDVPAGWKDIQPPQIPRIAHLTFTNGHDNGQVVVTRFPGTVGGALMNVNRWRGQAGLGEVRSLDQHQPPIEKMMDGKAVLVDISRPGNDPHSPRIIVLYYPRDGYTWFFKMQGAFELLDAEKAAFVGFVQSLRFGDDK